MGISVGPGDGAGSDTTLVGPCVGFLVGPAVMGEEHDVLPFAAMSTEAYPAAASTFATVSFSLFGRPP